MKKRKLDAYTNSFWHRAMSAEKFEENGLWGLKDPSGEIVLKPQYDQIEFCTDFIYARYQDCHRYFYKEGGWSDCIDRVDDYRFYKDGMIGLKTCEGDILIPAMYDEIIDWGKKCDVIYVRKGKEFHYYNHNLEEILTEAEEILEDSFPDCPYNLGEDQNRNVLLCVEPIEKKEGNRDCYAYNQWVRLSRIRYSDVRQIFSDCEVVSISPDAINFFEDKCTYIYSARVCTSSGEFPLTNCIEKIKTLGCYDSSWYYLIKISVNRNTKINPYDLYNVIKHFEGDLKRCMCKYDIAIDYDDTLADEDARLFQIHFYWDDGGAFLYDNFIQEILPNGTIEDIKNELDKQTPQDRRKMVVNAFGNIKSSEIRSWDDTQKVLEYLKSEGAKDYSTLIARYTGINPYSLGLYPPDIWQYKKNIITWALDNGGQLNQIHNGKTLYETFIEDLESAKERLEDETGYEESVENAEEYAVWLKSKGAITASEQQEKIMAKLDGLNPQEVLNLVAKI